MPLFGAQPEGTGLFFRNSALLRACVESTLRLRRLVLQKNSLRRNDLFRVNRPSDAKAVQSG